MIEIIKALLYGILEGTTEWLPISSTGHLILLRELVPLKIAPSLGKLFADEYFDMFEVVIQLGAILAVAVSFFSKLFPFSRTKSKKQKRATLSLWSKIFVASLPAAFVGIVLDKMIERLSGKDIDGWIYTPFTVAVALIVYGILFIVVERVNINRNTVTSTDGITLSQATLIGCFQALSIVPGTSRSGSTMLGARILGFTSDVAAEFSFFMSIPAMAGGSLVKAWSFFSFVGECGIKVPLTAWLCLAFASAAAFAVSMITIRFLMDFVKKHGFSPFGVYRIILGALVLGYFITR
ncbi:MAG: undecaprenyl-diphosphate phosphatase [Ruminococcaceae bacterium]|nr:undecaprenyl-diphosphate phosphatase [Oscillospiraceae bacterium]